MCRLWSYWRLAAWCLLVAMFYRGTGCTTIPFLNSGGDTIVPVVSSPALLGEMVQGQASTVTVSVTATSSVRTIARAIADLTKIGGSAAQVLSAGDNDLFSWTGTVIPPGSGLQPITFTASDTHGLTATASLDVTVNANMPITAPLLSNPLATGSLTAQKPCALKVSVIATDAADSIQAVTADLSAVGGPAAQALVQGANNLWSWVGTVTPPLSGTHQIVVTAKDTKGLTTVASIGITVAAVAANTAPQMSNLVASGSLMVHRPGTLSVSVTVRDSQDAVKTVTVDLSQVGGPATQSLAQGDNSVWSWNGTLTPAISGSRQVSVSATDEHGLSSVAVTDVTVAVFKNTPPRVTSAFVSGVLVVNVPGRVTVSVNATDSDGTVQQVTADLSSIGGPPNQALSPAGATLWSASASVTPATTGTFSVTFTARDEVGGTTSATASIKVYAPGSTGSVMKNPLGQSTSFSGNEAGKIYVPTRYGGDLTLSGTQIELFYTDGSDLTPETAGLILHGDLGSSRVAQGAPCSYSVPASKPGWYYFRLTQGGSATITSDFMESGEAAYRPWNGWWWPRAPGVGPTLYDAGGPLSEYDQVYGTHAQDWEQSNDSGGAWWWGHCWGWSIASILVPDPQSTGTKGVSFSRDDMKGLYTEAADDDPYFDSSLSIAYIPPGPPTGAAGEEVDAYCDDLYRILRGSIREDQVPVQSDMRAIATPPNSSDQVWNEAIYKYTADFQEAPGANDEHLVQIDMVVNSNYDARRPPTDYTDDRVERYVYQLEFDATGQLVRKSPRQNWISSSHYPPHDLYRLTGSPFAAHNPDVTKARIDALYGK
jgi:hypothetical protein